ncbi:MAG: N-acetylglucosamine-6-phosphate deacetylase [Terriglobales bacterium]
MPPILLTASAVITTHRVLENGRILIEDGRIARVGTRDEIEAPADVRTFDFPDAVLAPGFVDIHIHGGAGFDVMHASADELAELEKFLASKGVTSYFPTTVTASLDATYVSLEALAAAIETADARASRDGELRAQPLGIHLEGPFLSHAKRGVHPPELLQPPSVESFDKLWQAARGTVAVMTVAPELENAQYLIREAAQRGVCVSLGHSDATAAQALAGIAAGGRHVTHTFNAMRALDHREPGLTGVALGDDRLSAELICDGIHVAPEVVKVWYRAKGRDRAVLVTDAISATGKGDGRFRLGPFEVEVKGDRCEYEGKLAGSVLTLDRAVRNLMEFASLDLPDSVRAATYNPARVTGVSGRKGALVEGADADIVVLTPRGEVVKTIVRGNVTKI